jgi:hypothetical protein
MSTVIIPEGCYAVVVIMPKGEDAEPDIKFHNVIEGSEHLFVADAITALASWQADSAESLLDELAEAEGGEPDEGEEPAAD